MKLCSNDRERGLGSVAGAVKRFFDSSFLQDAWKMLLVIYCRICNIHLTPKYRAVCHLTLPWQRKSWVVQVAFVCMDQIAQPQALLISINPVRQSLADSICIDPCWNDRLHLDFSHIRRKNNAYFKLVSLGGD